MSLSLTYEPLLSRVRLDITSVPALQASGLRDYVLVEKSLNGTTWTPIRGGQYATASAAGEVGLDDYEFAPGVVNTYRYSRPTLLDAFGRTSTNSWGNATTGQAWANDGLSANDFDVASNTGTHTITGAGSNYRSIVDRNITDAFVGVTFRVDNTPTVAGIRASVIARYADASNFLYAEVNIEPTSVMTINIGQYAAGVRTDFSGVTLDDPHNTATWYRLEMWVTGTIVRARCYPTVGTPPEYWLVASDAFTVFSPGDVGVGSVRVTGNTNSNQVVRFQDFIESLNYTVDDTETITPSITSVWLKSTARPFLNREVIVADFSALTYDGRGGSFVVAGRPDAVGTTEVIGPMNWTLSLRTDNADDRLLLDYLVASGDILYVQVPPSVDMPSGYFQVQRASVDRKHRHTVRRYHELELGKRVRPAPAVAGTTVTWAGVIAAYESWSDAIADNTDWAELLDIVMDPSLVVDP